jgi:hypothetical protein
MGKRIAIGIRINSWCGVEEIDGFGGAAPGGKIGLAWASIICYSSNAFVALVTPLELDFRGAASYNSQPFCFTAEASSGIK